MNFDFKNIIRDKECEFILVYKLFNEWVDSQKTHSNLYPNQQLRYVYEYTNQDYAKTKQLENINAEDAIKAYDRMILNMKNLMVKEIM